MSQGKSSPELLTFEEAAAYLNVTSAWLRRAVAERRISYLKFNRLLRFDRAVLDVFIRDSVVRIADWR